MSSILEKILTQKHAENIRGFDPTSMLHRLLEKLTDREREVVRSRFGLVGSADIQTLEEIGGRLKVTRERVRQITKSSIHRLKDLGSKDEEVARFTRVVEHFLQSYGGALEEEYFIEQLLDFAHILPADARWQSASRTLRFLLDYVLSDVVERQEADEVLRARYALHGAAQPLLRQTAQALLGIINGEQKPLESGQFVRRFVATSFNQEHYQAIIAEPVHIARDFYGNDPTDAQPTTEEESRVVLAYATITTAIAKNIFAEWGRVDWATIRPRRMNDKIYLVLYRAHEPLHFTDIAARINDAHFDKKIARPPSVHNELILDKRFVLVGRGLYALKEWGYQPGTVADVVAELLRGSEGQRREEIVSQLLKKRFVKKQTIHLALMNKERFEKLDDGRYRLAQKIT